MLEELVTRWAERDRLILAGLRDVAHHMPSASADTSTDDDSAESE